ncbi:MAG: hypothetical protein RR336_06995 [Oscillospiraceae bacterium]
MEREKLAGAVQSIAWGYVLLHLNINLGTLDVLPNWAGYVLILRTLPILGKSEPSALLLRPLGILLALWEGLLWGLTIFSIPFDSTIVSILGSVASLYFHFQLLTNLASLAQRYRCPEERKILNLRTVRTLLITLLALPFNWRQYSVVSVCVVFAHIIVALWICSVLFSLRRSLMAYHIESSAG